MSMPQEQPESAPRRNETKHLQALLATLVTELHILRTTSLAHAEAMYASLFGDLIVAALGAEINCRRERKRLEFLRSSLAVGIMPDAESIEERLSAEMSVWQAQLEVAIAEALQRQEWVESERNPERMRELRSLLRELAQRFHPDVIASDATIAKYRVWKQGQVLYEARELKGLRDLLSANEDFPHESNGAETQITALEFRIERTMREIEDLRARPPLTYLYQIHDEKWRDEHREELERRVGEYEDRRRDIEDEALRLLGFDPDDGAHKMTSEDEEVFNASRLNLADLLIEHPFHRKQND